MPPFGVYPLLVSIYNVVPIIPLTRMGGFDHGLRLRYLGIDSPPLSGQSAVMARKPRIHFAGNFII